jgi:hypothetical protein
MSDRDPSLIDAVSRSMMDLQTSPSGSLGAELRQPDDMQSSEGQSSFLFRWQNFLTLFQDTPSLYFQTAPSLHCPPRKVTTQTKGLNTFPLARMTLPPPSIPFTPFVLVTRRGNPLSTMYTSTRFPVPPHLCPFHPVTMAHRGAVPRYLPTRDPSHGIRLL